MTRLLPPQYVNPHVLAGVRGTNQVRKVLRFVGKPCPYCGVPMSYRRFDDNPTRDHKIPKSRGGAMLRNNIHVCCRACNSDKGNLDDEEYMAVLTGIASRLRR